MKRCVYLVIALLVLSACVPEQPQPIAPISNQPVIIGFAAEAHDRRLFQPLIDQFNATNADVQVQFVITDPELPAHQRFALADTLISISLQADDYQSGYLRDLQPFMQADPSFRPTDYVPGVFEQLGHAGQVFGVPYLIQLPMLHYNQDLVERAGVTITSDWSWDDFLTAIERTASPGTSETAVYGFLEEFTGATTTIALLNAQNSPLLYLKTPPVTPNIIQPEVEQVIEQLAQLYTNQRVYNRQEAMTKGVAINKLIQAGQVAIWPSYMFSHQNNVGSNPIRIGTMMYPQAAVPRTTPSYHIVMSRATQHPDHAWRWIAFLSQHYLPGLSLPFAPVGWSTARQSLRERFVTDAQLTEQDQRMQQTLLARPQDRNLQTFDSQTVRVIGRAAQQVIEQNLPIRTALQTAQEDLNKAYQQAWLTPTTTPEPLSVIPTITPTAQPEPNATLITFAGFDDPAEQQMLIDRFNAQQDSIFVQSVTLAPDQSSSLAQLAEHSDCFVSDLVPTQNDLPDLVDLEPLISADPTFHKSDYLSGLLDLHRIDAKTYGLAYAFTPQKLLYINRERLQRAALAEPTQPLPLPAFFAYANAMRSESQADPSYGFASPAFMTTDLDSLLIKQGSKLYHATEHRVDYTSPANSAALRDYVALIASTSPHNRLQHYTADDQILERVPAFEQGHVGLWFDRLDQLLRHDHATIPISVTFAPYTWGPLTQADYRLTSLFIAARTPHAAACWAFFRSLQLSGVVRLGSLPANKTTANTPSFRQLYGNAVIDEYLRVFDRPLTLEPHPPVDWFWLYRAVDRAIQGEDLERELQNAENLTNAYLQCLHIGDRPATCATTVDPTYEGFSQ
jgi:ABC-type glycerol-3-phosphate transport system substrate-binding protein